MRWIVGTLLLAVALAGCSDPFEPVEPVQGLPSKGPVAVTSADPPTRFTEQPSTPLEISTEAQEVLLHGLTAIVPIHGNDPFPPRTGEELRLVDTRTGATRQSVRPSHPLPKTEVRALPTLTTVGGRATVLMPFLVEAPAQGTAPGRPLVEVVSVDPENGEPDWRVEIPLDGWTPPTGNPVEVSFAGVDAGVAVIRLEEVATARRRGDTIAVDLSTRTVLWRQAGFESRAVAAGVVIGRKPGPGEYPKVEVLGLDARTGQRKWASSRGVASLVEVHGAGPTLAVVDGDVNGARYIDVVNIASGRTVATQKETPGFITLNLSRCVYDQQAVVVCHSGSDWITAIDAKTGASLWVLARGRGRQVPRVTGAWHGVVYGWVDNLRPVVLDAKTGADREVRPGTFPSVVNESMAIGPWTGGSHGSGIYPVLG